MNPQANMAAVNATGGPVGGTPVMGNGMPPEMDSELQKRLDTYIYDYFLQNKYFDVARAFSKQVELNYAHKPKPSPGRRDVNGVDDSMDSDNKDDLHRIPADLQPAQVPPKNSDNSFLYDWWAQFWDMYAAARNNHNKPLATQYVQHAQQQARMRQETQQRMIMQQQGMNPMQYRMQMQQNMQNMQNGMAGKDLQRQAMQNNRTPQQQQQMMQNMQKQQMLNNNMQRDGSNMEMGGPRPQSPGSGDNAPSPSKRPRLDGQGFNGQQMNAARSQGMQGPGMGQTSASAAHAGQMLLQNGINPNDMPATQFSAFQASNPAAQQKSIEVYSQNIMNQQRQAMNNPNMGKAMNPGVQGSPMAQQGLEGSADLFSGNNPRAMGGPSGQPQGNHALQDYQMQLMLLEQQNKKRLLMARQEQDNMTQHPGSAPMGQPGFAQAMSPQGSRAGPSPNPNDMVKGTPKPGQAGLPGSPMPDGSMPQNRGSPMPNFDPSQMPPGAMPPYYPQMAGGMVRPPTTNPAFNAQFNPQQMAAMRATGQMPPGFPQHMQQQMMQQQAQQQQQQQGQQPPQMGTPQHRNAMPPPPAPQPNVEAQRTQPSSPAQAPAPPTPQQSNKAGPKKAKEKKETGKKANPGKKAGGATGATPASESEPPPTPTPATPTQNNAPPPQAAAPPVAPPTLDPNAGQPFGDLGGGSDINLDFGGMEGDVLEHFDFDSFLQTDDGGNGFAFDLNSFGGADGVEAGDTGV